MLVLVKTCPVSLEMKELSCFYVIDKNFHNLRAHRGTVTGYRPLKREFDLKAI